MQKKRPASDLLVQTEAGRIVWIAVPLTAAVVRGLDPGQGRIHLTCLPPETELFRWHKATMRAVILQKEGHRNE